MKTPASQALLEAAPDGMIVVARDGRITLVNAQAESTFGYSRQEMLGQPVEMLIPAGDRDAHVGHRDAFLADPRTRSMASGKSLRGRRKDGTEFHAEISLSPVETDDGLLVIAAVRDVTERALAAQRAKEQERKVFESERFLRATLDALSGHIAILDRHGTIVTVNAAWSQFARRNDPAATGCPIGYAVGENYLALCDAAAGPDAPAAREIAAGVRAVLRGESEDLSLEYPCHGPHEERWFLACITRFDGPSPPHLVVAHEDVTARRRAETELQEREERFRELADAMPQIVWSARPDGQGDYYNDRWYEFTGFPRRPAGDADWRSVVHPEDLQPCVDRWARAVSSGEPFEMELRFKDRTTGSYRWHLSRGVPVRDRSGQIVRWYGTSTDVDGMRRAEEALRKAEQRYRTLFTSSRDAIMTLAPPTWYFTAGNAAAVAMFRAKDEAEFVSKGPWELSPERQPDGELSQVKAAAMIAKAMAEGSHFFEWAHQRLGGDVFPANVLLTRVSIEGETFLQATVRDTTELQQAARERNRLIGILERSLNEIYLFDAETLRFEFANASALRNLGYSLDALRTMTPLGLKPEYDETSFRAMVRPLLAGERDRLVFETVHRRADGTLYPVLVHLQCAGQVERPALLALILDITERKKTAAALLDTEHALRETAEQLRQAQKMEAIGRLAGGIAHDFNNLLTPINGYAELLLGQLGAQSPLAREVEQIKRAGARAAELTRQLLAFGRKQVLQPRVLNINKVLRELRPMLSRLVGESIELALALAEDLGHARIDPGQLEQVVVNLCVNARDAIRECGTLAIETRNVSFDAAYCREHPEVEPGAHVMLAVSDNGAGMTEEVRARIFEPFFTTKPKDKGTGLGLSTVYGIVKQSGGQVTVHSEVGRGTTFRLYFPRVTEAEEPSVTPGNGRVALSPRGHETVLVVEDDALVRELARAVLAMNGYTVLLASNGAAALEACEKHAGAIHLVLTDVVMPVMCGRELQARVSKRWPDVKFLFTSGYTENAIVHRGVLDPGVDFIPKPFSPGDLVRAIRAVLDAPRR